MNFCQKSEIEKQRNMKTSQSPSHGLAKSSLLRLTSKNNYAATSSSKNLNQNSIEDVEENMFTAELSKSLDSPYKNSLTNIKYVPPVDDLNDFKTPEPIKKVSKISQAKVVSLNKPTRTRKSKTKKLTKNKNCIFKITKDNFGQTDVNPDHLQMALALSKSTYDLENPVKSDHAQDLPSFSSPKKIAKSTTLEKFGFKSDKPKIHPKVQRGVIEVSKKNKHSKFRFVTPILQVRTPEEREAIITSKISLILNQNSDPPSRGALNDDNELFSDLLRKYNNENTIFKANQLSLEEAVGYNYYSKSLNITPTELKCGYLLRNWDEILGRDKSPVRKKLVHSEELINKDCDYIGNHKDIDSKEIDIRDVNIDFQKHSAIDKDNVAKNIPTTNECCSKEPEFGNTLDVHNKEDRHCISPDLFASEDEADFAPNTPETDVFSQSLLNLSPSKSQGLLRSNNLNLANSQEQKLEFSKRNLFKDNQGIEHFESYHDDFKCFSQEVYDLVQSSEDEATEELYLKSLKNDAKTVSKPDLTQNSSRNDVTNRKLEIVRSCKSNQQIEYLIEKAMEDKYQSHSDLKETESNFDMSPLLLKESNEFIQNSFTTNTELLSKSDELDLGCARLGDSAVNSPCKMNNKSPIVSRKSYRMSELNSTAMLNVTDYVMQILNQDDEGTVENVDQGMHNPNYSNKDKIYSNLSEKSYNNLICDIGQSSTSRGALGNSGNHCDNPDKLPDSKFEHSCSQESIIISDEELNYSSIYSRDKNKKHVTSLSQDSCSQESIVISDEELNYSSVSCSVTKSKKQFYDLSDTEVELNIGNNMDIDEANNAHLALKAKYGSSSISEPIHNRITELKQSSRTKESPVKNFLEDSFNYLLENPEILEKLESEARAKEIQKNERLTCESTNKENIENKCDNVTPKKCNLQILPSFVESDITPENNLIIKTDNITPMANYDEMDTPKVTKELQQFGLKPLKRQRGVKLLKYLYECTHPLVGPKENAELTTEDEDDQRKIKRKKSCNTTKDKSDQTVAKQDNYRWDDGNVDIVGDRLLENEKLEDLIFERKYSVKIPSCRIPLQIVWHNFVSNNPEIMENILLYEPLQLEVLHSMLKEQTGCKFHIQDLLTFFDKKCITIRTAQAQGRRRTRK